MLTLIILMPIILIIIIIIKMQIIIIIIELYFVNEDIETETMDMVTRFN